MFGINKVILVGKVVEKSQLYKVNGDKIVVFIETSETWTDKRSGERKEKIERHRVVIHDTFAKLVEKYIYKEYMLHIEGKICAKKLRYEDGSDRLLNEIEVKAHNGGIIQLISKKQI